MKCPDKAAFNVQQTCISHFSREQTPFDRALALARTVSAVLLLVEELRAKSSLLDV